MDPAMPPGLREIIQRSLDAARELQLQITSLSMGSTTTIPWDTLVQAHTAHLLNHNAILKGATEKLATSDPASAATFQTLLLASDQMVKDARAIHEHVIHSQVTKQRVPVPLTATPASKRTRHKATLAEESNDEKPPTLGESDLPPGSAGRRNKAHWNKAPTTQEEEMTRSSPKRALEFEEATSALQVVKRTKLAPPPSNDPQKRKSDVSMADLDGNDDDEYPPSSSPPSKRQKHEEPVEVPLAHVEVEYEDITAEVDARMRQHEERREREMKQELGIADKRKRQSNDSFTVDLEQEDTADKPSRKRKKHKHMENASDG